MHRKSNEARHLISIVACWTMVAVESFSPSQFGNGHVIQRRRSDPMVMHVCNDETAEFTYGMGGQNLWQRWIELASEGHVTATTTLTDDECDEKEKGLRVRYGVRLEEDTLQQQSQQQPQRLLEFVEILSQEQEEGCESSGLRDRIYSINTTLAEMQHLTSNQNQNGLAIQCVYDGPYAAQLQLLRTLRPPRSKDMSSSNASEQASCQPPTYDASTDSFLVGSLRLFGHGEFHGDGQPRERAARLLVPRDVSTVNDESSPTEDDAFTPWDVFHNISPVDPRGHYLLLPAIDDEREWRDQSLIPSDCYDVTYLASTIEPPGTMVLCFNSVGAGASQNHIHCHAWVSPPPPLLGRKGAAMKASATSSFHLADGVTVSLLDYPCTCIKLSASARQSVGNALSRIVQLAQKMQAPHNVAWTNRALKGNGDAQKGQSKNMVTVEVYVFLRKAETTDRCYGTFRLGASEMLGVFHSSSKEQLESLSDNMAGVLSDVSWEPRTKVWKDVCQALEIQNKDGDSS